MEGFSEEEVAVGDGGFEEVGKAREGPWELLAHLRHGNEKNAFFHSCKNIKSNGIVSLSKIVL